MLLKFNFSSIFLIKFVYMLSNLLFVKILTSSRA